ncbi:MAG: hypothetical protein E6Q40_00930 [Cupriavidus sp.]|nr:MAG: hypothetical protein E6Q40_00930 [Cupriavidus sp.]
MVPIRRGQKKKRTVGTDGKVRVSYTLKYIFKSESATELTVLDVYNLLGITEGSLFADDPTCSLGEIDIDRTASKPPQQAWLVELTYSNEAPVPENASPDPTQRRIKMDKGYRELTRNIIKDKNGKAILNAAGDPYQSGVPVTTYPETFNYQWARNTPSKGFHQTINLNKFNGCDPFTLMCLVKSSLEYEGSYRFWNESIEMIYDPLGWKPRPLNAGIRQRKAGLTKLIDILDAFQQPVTEPQPLYDAASEDADSSHIEGTEVPVSDRPNGCTYVTVEYFDIKDFAKIGVPEFPQ